MIYIEAISDIDSERLIVPEAIKDELLALKKSGKRKEVRELRMERDISLKEIRATCIEHHRSAYQPMIVLKKYKVFYVIIGLQALLVVTQCPSLFGILITGLVSAWARAMYCFLKFFCCSLLRFSLLSPRLATSPVKDLFLMIRRNVMLWLEGQRLY